MWLDFQMIKKWDRKTNFQLNTGQKNVVKEEYRPTANNEWEIFKIYTKKCDYFSLRKQTHHWSPSVK